MSEKTGGKKRKMMLWLIIAGVVLAGVALTLILTLGHSREPAGVRSSDDRPKAEEYMAELGGIVSIAEAKTSGIANTEAEASRAFAERGFSQYPLTFCYDMDGHYTGEQEATPGSSTRHPYYSCYYMTTDEVAWRITAVGNVFFAEPLTYLDEAGWQVSHIVAETATILNYDGAANTYYEIRPDANTLVLKQVRRVDAETLSTLTIREVDAP